MPRRYRRLKGSSAYYPFAARTDLRAARRRTARGLQAAGCAALLLAGVLFFRESVLHGGQPVLSPLPGDAPAAPLAATAEVAQTGHRVTVVPRAATPDALAGTADTEAEAQASPAPAATAAPQQLTAVLPQYRALYAQNPDMVGWLSIPALELELPVLCSPGDNEYYLRRGFDRLYAAGGSLFLDERCRLGSDGQDPGACWLVYGHNMRDGSMLAGLTAYRDEAFYKANPTFRFDTLYQSTTWQVVAALDTTLGADALPYYTFFDAATAREWQDRVDAILPLALYDTGVTPEYGEQLLILSTCGEPALHTATRFALVAIPARA